MLILLNSCTYKKNSRPLRLELHTVYVAKRIKASRLLLLARDNTTQNDITKSGEKILTFCIVFLIVGILCSRIIAKIHKAV